MGNTIWSKLNSKAKSKKSTYEISKKTNIPEEKVKEIMSGDRELPSDRVDDFIGVIKENDTAQKSIEMANMLRWVEETDLRALRKSFNYESQSELGRVLGMDSSVVCRLEGKKLDHISDAKIQKYYDFFHDELNKKVIKKKRPTQKKDVTFGDQNLLITNIADEEDREALKKIKFKDAVKWYKNFDLREYLNDNNLTYKEFVTRLGYNPNSVSLVSNLISGKIDISTTGRSILIKSYAYINGLMKAQNKAVDERNDKVEELAKEEAIVAPEPKEVANIEHIMEDVTPEEETYLKNDSDSTESYYYQVHDPDGSFSYKPSSITYDDGEYTVKYDPPKEEARINITFNEYAKVKDELFKCEEEIERLKKQVERYEKLIDMIER